MAPRGSPKVKVARVLPVPYLQGVLTDAFRGGDPGLLTLDGIGAGCEVLTRRCLLIEGH